MPGSRVVELECPNCGATLQVGRDTVSCRYCGSSLAVEREEASPAPPVPRPQPAARPVPRRYAGPPRRGAGPPRRPAAQWGIRSLLAYGTALAVLFLISAVGWAVVGPYHDSIAAFALWCGAAPLLLLATGVFWDSSHRKIISTMAMLAVVTLGFVAGMALFDWEWFNRVIHGSYTDDTAAYLAIVLGANLLGYLIGLLAHHLVAVSIARRAHG